MECRIPQKLINCGVPEEVVAQGKSGLVAYLKNNRSELQAIISSILPGCEEVKTLVLSGKYLETSGYQYLRNFCRGSTSWIKWLLFEEDPESVLEELGKQNAGQGVCGVVWGNKDIAYKCRTCEHDPTCAICVPCFKAGNHVNHDYFMIHTGGGCCDCGDETAWKVEGFCSKHRGPGQVQPLPPNYVSSAEPVLSAVLIEWKERLLAAERVSEGKPKKWESQTWQEKVAYMTTATIAEMLLSFCKSSESLLNFTATMVRSSPGLLAIMLRSERFLYKKMVKALHELLFKLLGEPSFKYEFAKAFVRHYPTLISEAIQEGIDGTNSSGRYSDDPVLGNFSVQIFTVPTLTPRLVTELNLLDILLGNLRQVFSQCAGEDGRLLASKGPIANHLYTRLLEDIRCVMSLLEVEKYVACERPDLSRGWIQLLVFIQGMDTRKRVTSIHVEQENDNWYRSCLLEYRMAQMHPLFVNGAASVNDVKWIENKSLMSEQDDSDDDGDVIRHTKIGRLSEESSMVRMVGRNTGSDFEISDVCPVSTVSSLSSSMESGNMDIDSDIPTIPAALRWLITECIKALDSWLRRDTAKDLRKPPPLAREKLSRKVVQLRGRGERGLIRDMHSSNSIQSSSRLDTDTSSNRGGIFRELLRRGCRIASHAEDDRTARTIPTENDNNTVSEMDLDMGSNEDLTGQPGVELEIDRSSIFRLQEWPAISYDVSRQDISFHMPLHRLLSLSLHKAMGLYTSEHEHPEKKRDNLSIPLAGSCHKFFRQLLGNFHPYSFSAFVMEHLLRLKVFCAQVHAGMWRHNGHSTFSLCKYYHSVPWYEHTLELDLFLLQCCAAMAPAESFVCRILERFGLSDYLSLHLIRPNEYEPTLTQEMLALIIRIVGERGFCGLSSTESLKRELIRKLSVGDATRSQLLKALPRRFSDNKDLQEVLDTVANFSHPSGMQQGKYSLRKDFWKEFDFYHPCWKSRELQIAEERYSRFCKASAVVMQQPSWRKPFYPLENIWQIATSKIVLQIIRSVVFYAAFSDRSSDSRAPDGVLFTALHLLALGLDICSSAADQKIHLKNREIAVHGSTSNSVSVENEAMLMDSTTSHDEQDSPPILAYADEVIDVGSTDRPEVSNHQSLLSLLVLLMQKYEGGNEQGISTYSSQCNVAVLIRNLLEKFAKLHRGCMGEIEKLSPSIVHGFFMSRGEYSGLSGTNISEVPTILSDAERKRALARERQAAVMAKMKAAQAKFAASLGSDPNSPAELKQGKSLGKEEEGSEGKSSAVCSLCRELECKSPTAFLTLVQKSRLLSFAEKGPPSWDRPHLNGDDSANNYRGNNSISAPALGSSEALSPDDMGHFIQNILDGENGDGHLVEGLLDILGTQFPLIARNTDVSEDSDTNLLVSEDVGEDDSAIEDDNDSGKDAVSHPYIGLCESAAAVRKGMAPDSDDAVSVVLKEYISAICKVMSKQQKDPENQSEVHSRESSVASSPGITFDGFGPSDCDGIHVSSCGHAVHQECLDRYLSSLRQSSRIIFEGVQIVDPSQGEFLCPVCRRLVNSVLPVLSDGHNSAMPQILPYGESSLTSTAGFKSLRLEEALSLLQNAEELSSKRGYHKSVSCYIPESAKVAIESFSQKLYALYLPEKSISKAESARLNQSLVLWDVFRYSLLTAELAARSSKPGVNAGGSATSLEVLHSVVYCTRGSVLSLIHQVAKSTQRQNRLTILLRSRGMQLLVGSISCGVSRDMVSANSLSGNISSLLEHIDKGKEYADIQFWKRMADPVLIHDPFSSFVWLLFCLPIPLPSEIEPFISLLHIFYVVCLVQAIAYAVKSIFPDSDMKSGSYSFIKSISTVLSGTVLSQIYSEADDTDLLLVPTELLIRRLTLPYLRRCLLLHKLLYPSSAHLYEADDVEKSTGNMGNDCTDNKYMLKELEELQWLEKLFQLPALEAILEDKNVHALALSWCQHVSREAGSRTYKHVVRCLPACPFELMRLPHLYQDLLQRYIKECCPVCKTVPNQPALCLLCGTLCCAPSRRRCCRQHECIEHAMSCGAGVGVFLLIRRTNILLQRSKLQALWPSPYLDAFGDEDYDMQRGKPLYLSRERYAALTQMVVSHGLDHSSHFLLQTTRDANFII